MKLSSEGYTYSSLFKKRNQNYRSTKKSKGEKTDKNTLSTKNLNVTNRTNYGHFAAKKGKTESNFNKQKSEEKYDVRNKGKSGGRIKCSGVDDNKVGDGNVNLYTIDGSGNVDGYVSCCGQEKGKAVFYKYAVRPVINLKKCAITNTCE